jgi:hypothetical protein
MSPWVVVAASLQVVQRDSIIWTQYPTASSFLFAEDWAAEQGFFERGDWRRLPEWIGTKRCGSLWSQITKPNGRTYSGSTFIGVVFLFIFRTSDLDLILALPPPAFLAPYSILYFDERKYKWHRFSLCMTTGNANFDMNTGISLDAIRQVEPEDFAAASESDARS